MFAATIASTMDVIEVFIIILIQTSKTATSVHMAIELFVGKAILQPFVVLISLGTSWGKFQATFTPRTAQSLELDGIRHLALDVPKHLEVWGDFLVIASVLWYDIHDFLTILIERDVVQGLRDELERKHRRRIKLEIDVS